MIITCRNCGIKNNLPDKLPEEKRPICGKCKQPLDLESIALPVTVTDQTFESEVLQSTVPVLIDCWAPWCGPCHMMSPILEKLAVELGGKIKICKLNVDQNPLISNRFRIQSIPTLLFFKNGRLVDQLIGLRTEQHIKQFIGIK